MRNQIVAILRNNNDEEDLLGRRLQDGRRHALSLKRFLDVSQLSHQNDLMCQFCPKKFEGGKDGCSKTVATKDTHATLLRVVIKALYEPRS